MDCFLRISFDIEKEENEWYFRVLKGRKRVSFLGFLENSFFIFEICMYKVIRDCFGEWVVGNELWGIREARLDRGSNRGCNRGMSSFYWKFRFGIVF